jgi:hypothetical protein
MPKIDHDNVETDQEGDGDAANNNYSNELCWEYSHCDRFVVGWSKQDIEGKRQCR